MGDGIACILSSNVLHMLEMCSMHSCDVDVELLLLH
jgi:hypothetical protein